MNVKKRNEVEDKFKWRIEDLYENNEKWEESFKDLESRIGEFEGFKGKLDNSGSLAECLRKRDKVAEQLHRLYVYANMRLHENAGDDFFQGLSDRAEYLATRFSMATSFMEPEILQSDEGKIKQFMSENQDLAIYTHYFNDLLRLKDHVQTPEIEELLASAQEIGQAADNIYAMINNADIRFGKVKNDEDKEVEVTHGRYMSLLESRNREVRIQTFNTYYDSYIKQKNTLGATYNSSVKKDVFFARSRKFGSSLEMALSTYNIPKEVYTNLIAAVSEFLPSMHKYISIRKRILNVGELHPYDLYTPIVPEANTAVNYDDAKATVLKSLEPMGSEYLDKVKEAFDSGWIDVYENEGKRSGAYSWGAFGCHPYILMNYDNKINDMFTLTHEMGHAMHSYFAWSTQPYIYHDYTIFLAEIASTVNECLLMDHLLKTTEDQVQKRYLINYYLEQFRGTVFRQTMFAEFELITHEMVEKGEPLTAASLSKVYRSLNEKYYGSELVIDSALDMEWSRIPHFYNAFYVYQYATGFSAAVDLSNKILNEGNEAVTKYIDMLKGGSSDYSIELLKKAGVDMTTPEPIKEALKVFDGLLKEFE